MAHIGLYFALFALIWGFLGPKLSVFCSKRKFFRRIFYSFVLDWFYFFSCEYFSLGEKNILSSAKWILYLQKSGPIGPQLAFDKANNGPSGPF